MCGHYHVIYDKYSASSIVVSRVYLRHDLFASCSTMGTIYVIIILLKLRLSLLSCFIYVAWPFGIIKMSKTGQENVSCGEQYDASLPMINYALRIIFLLYMFPLSSVVYISSVFYCIYFLCLLIYVSSIFCCVCFLYLLYPQSSN